MTIRTGLRALLAADAGVQALVGTAPARIHSGQLPQKPTLPAIVFYLASGPKVSALDGPTGFAQDRWSFDCWGDDEDAAAALADAVEAALDGFTGTADDTTIRGCTQDNRLQSIIEEETRDHRVTVDFMITHNG